MKITWAPVHKHGEFKFGIDWLEWDEHDKMLCITVPFRDFGWYVDK